MELCPTGLVAAAVGPVLLQLEVSETLKLDCWLSLQHGTCDDANGDACCGIQVLLTSLLSRTSAREGRSTDEMWLLQGPLIALFSSILARLCKLAGKMET